MLGGLAPAVDGFLQRMGSCSGQAPVVDGFLQWFLQWTGPCSGLVPVAACEGGTDYPSPEIWQNVEHDNAPGIF